MAKAEIKLAYPTTALFLKTDWAHFRRAVETSNGVCVKRIQRRGELPAQHVVYQAGEKSEVIRGREIPSGTFFAELTSQGNTSLKHFWIAFARRTGHDSEKSVRGPEPFRDTDSGK